MIGLLISFLTFLAVFLLIFFVNLAIVDLFKKERDQRLREMESDLRIEVRRRAKESIDEVDTNLAELAKASDHKYFSLVDFFHQFRDMITQAGLHVSAVRIWWTSVGISLVLAVAIYMITRMPVLCVIVVFLGVVAPVAYVSYKRKQRLDKLCSQLPDALDLMSRVLRAGQTTTQGMNAVAEEFKPPVAEEFGYCYEQQNLGISTEVALRQLALRTGLMELKIFVMAVLIQRSSGGNLAELLEKLAKVIRQRFEIRGTIKSLTAEGRLQATMLIGLPFVVWVLLYFANRTYALKLLEHPDLIMVTIGMMFIGALWIRKIVNFDF